MANPTGGGHVMLEVKASNPFFRATWGFPGVSGHAVKVGWGSNGHPLSQCGRQAADYLKGGGDYEFFTG